MQGLEVTKLTRVSNDPRRSIYEAAVETPTTQKHQVLVIKKPKPGEQMVLGNHYHARDNEYFTLVKGRGRLVVQPLDDQGRPDGERVEYELASNTRVVMPTYWAHAFVFEGAAVMVCSSTAPFDPDDLIPYHLV